MRRRDRLYHWLRERPLVVDAGFAVLFGLVVLVLFPPTLSWPDGLGPVPSGLLAAAMVGTIVFRRVRPVASFSTLVALHLVQWASGTPLDARNVLVIVGMYSIAAYGPRRLSRWALAVGLLGALLASLRDFSSDLPLAGSVLVGASLVVMAAWAMGDVRSVRAAFERQLVERAELAERDRDQRVRIATVEERTRIAREMHDVVAHSLSVMIIQADGGRYAASSHPAAAVGSLETIAATGREALTEMRRLLGVLRDTPADGGVDPLLPQPGLLDLDPLVDRVRDAGLPVRLVVDGERRTVPDSVGLTVFRIAQEALTNTMKHAGPVREVQVTLRYVAGAVEVTVTDDGRGAGTSDDGEGNGLLGMRERAAVHGGTVEARPGRGGGWLVRALVPDGGGPVPVPVVEQSEEHSR